MKRNHRKSLILHATLTYLVLCTTGTAFAGSSSYTLVDLGSLPGGSSIGRHISEQGRVVGSSGVLHGNHEHAFVWAIDQGMRDLGALPGSDYSAAFAVNSAGDIVGESNTDKAVRAVLWSAKGNVVELGALPGDNASRAYSINDSGHVVGFSSGPSGVRAFIWTKESGMQSLGTLSGGNYSEALAINNFDQVVGVSTSTSGKHAFLWSKSEGMLDLGVLPGDNASRASRINDAGMVVGSSLGAAGVVHAFIWSKTGGMQDLGSLPPMQYPNPALTLPPGQYSEALDVNMRGQVVGASRNPMGGRAFLWTKQTGMEDLNSIIPAGLNVVLAAALHINNRGQIVCMGGIHNDLPEESHELDNEHHAGPLHVFLLTPQNGANDQ